MGSPVASAAVVSYRLGGTDGVSIEATKWIWALRELGVRVRTVAGAGVADRVVPALALDAAGAPDRDALERALEGAEMVVVENLCSLPLNPRASEAVAGVLRGRRAILRHHDTAAQRPALAHLGPPPDDPSWLHTCINEITRRELAACGIDAVVIRNCFDPDPPAGRRARMRRSLGVTPDELVLLQPTRAIPRKNVQAGIAAAAAIGATYWLLGPAEDGYGPELSRLFSGAPVRVLHGPQQGTPAGAADAYAACDAVVLPSTWEGFGNPSVESALHRKPLAIGSYPVAAELASFGFRWFDADDPAPLGELLAEHGSPALADLTEHNRQVARSGFSLTDLPARLEALLAAI